MALNTNVELEIDSWSAVREQALPIRFAVFVDEQQVPPELEVDEWDERCLHVIARNAAHQAVGTARLLPQPPIGKIGRMAVLASMRGQGIGGAMLQALLQAARAKGLNALELNAQLHAVPFYQRAGFAVAAPAHEEAGIAHVQMRLVF